MVFTSFRDVYTSWLLLEEKTTAVKLTEGDSSFTIKNGNEKAQSFYMNSWALNEPAVWVRSDLNEYAGRAFSIYSKFYLWGYIGQNHHH